MIRELVSSFGKWREVSVSSKKYFLRTLALILTTSLIIQMLPPSNVAGQATIRPSNSKGWGMFFGTTGDVRIDITESGVAVRIDMPREFRPGTAENDTSFVESNISNDYYYYSVIDQSEYYPYDLNAPYTIDIWNPPLYLTPECTGKFYNFTAPKFVRLKDLTAPGISGIYNFTVRIAKNMGSDGRPIFPELPNKVLQIPVSMREDPAYIYGYIADHSDPLNPRRIKAKGVVYAVGVTTGQIGRGYVDPETGFFNVTGLYAGEYRLEGSAGFFSETGFAYATTTRSFTVTVGKGGSTYIGDFVLNRGCIINGSITYVDQWSNPLRPLDSPYLNALNYHALNYTVEAYDTSGKIVASRIYRSNNLQTEPYGLLFRNGTKYVGYPALGTEYAGFGPGTYTIKIWVYGFTLPSSQVKTVTIASYGTIVNVGNSNLPYGAVVSGTIRLRHNTNLETPNEAELFTYGSSTGKHFGGNILVEMYSNEGVLKGLAVYNRTSSDGVVDYADFSSGEQNGLLKFYILGFSELYNKSYSGRWTIGSYPGPSPWDYGVETGTYYIRVWIRGYVQESLDEFTIGTMASNVTCPIDMQRAAAVQVTVESWNTKITSRRPQAPQPWRFLEWCPPPRLRVYFYRGGVEVGYAESILRLGYPGVTETTATLNFTGHNWSTDYIIFEGYVPTSLDVGNYTMKAYTYGYIQMEEFSFHLALGDFARLFMRLFIAGEIHGDVPLMMNGLFVTLTANVTVRPEVQLGGSLKGVNVTDVPKDSSRFGFSTYGFFGRGHFFYVDPQGSRWRDYGLDTGNYTVYVPEFGYLEDRRFMQTLDIYANVPYLETMVGVVFHVDRMVRVFGTVAGLDNNDRPVLLVWASISAQGRVSYSYDGDFMLHLPSGTGSVTFECPGYKSQTLPIGTNDQQQFTILLEQSGTAFP
jgi:hypothetical protein